MKSWVQKRRPCFWRLQKVIATVAPKRLDIWTSVDQVLVFSNVFLSGFKTRALVYTVDLKPGHKIGKLRSFCNWTRNGRPWPLLKVSKWGKHLLLFSFQKVLWYKLLQKCDRWTGMLKGVLNRRGKEDERSLLYNNHAVHAKLKQSLSDKHRSE